MHLRRPLLKTLALGLIAMGLAGCEPAKQLWNDLNGKPAFKSVDLTGANYATGFAMTDAQGKLRRLEEFKGQVVVVFFGYVQCPDVCPTTLADLALIKRQLGADGDKLQVVFVTVDPERDKPEIIQAYVDNFGSGMVGLRGTNEETKALALQFKVFYSRVRGPTPTSYTIDHTAGSYIYDRQGRLRLFSRYGMPTDELMQDIKALLRS